MRTRIPPSLVNYIYIVVFSFLFPLSNDRLEGEILARIKSRGDRLYVCMYAYVSILKHTMNR